ncbi:hypothetical protein ABFS83_12G115200 [Erythranthe nasuta]
MFTSLKVFSLRLKLLMDLTAEQGRDYMEQGRDCMEQGHCLVWSELSSLVSETGMEHQYHYSGRDLWSLFVTIKGK